MSKQIELPEDTYRDVQAMLASRGEGMDVEEYVNRTVSRDLFFETVRDIKARTKNVDPDELQKIIDEAVDAARAQRRKQSPGADCS
jgi:hypothetical protein